MFYPAMKAVRKTGQERFTLAGEPKELTLLNFWRWSVSDLVSNATRGRLAEFIVASALGVECDVRAEWDAYDLTTTEGINVEVKSAAYIQIWAQNTDSKLSGSVRVLMMELKLELEQLADKIERSAQSIPLIVIVAVSNRLNPSIAEPAV
jgi:hypothetical protein